MTCQDRPGETGMRLKSIRAGDAVTNQMSGYIYMEAPFSLQSIHPIVPPQRGSVSRDHCPNSGRTFASFGTLGSQSCIASAVVFNQTIRWPHLSGRMSSPNTAPSTHNTPRCFSAVVFPKSFS